MREAVMLVTQVYILDITEKSRSKNQDNPLLEAARFGHLFCNFFAEDFFSRQGVYLYLRLLGDYTLL